MQSFQNQSKLDIKAKKAREKNAKHLYTQGKVLFANQRFLEAINAFEKACELDESFNRSFELHYWLLLAYERTPKYQVADLEKKSRYAKKAIQIFASERKRTEFEKVAEVYAIEARTKLGLLKQNKNYSPEEKEEILCDIAFNYGAAATFGKRPEYRKALAAFYLEQKKPFYVLTSLKAALKLDPKDQETINRLTDFLLKWDASSASDWDSQTDQALCKNFDGIFAAIRRLPKENQFTLLCKFLHPLEKGRFRESLPAEGIKRQKFLEKIWEYLIKIDPDKPLNPFKTEEEKYKYYLTRGKNYLKNKECTKAIHAFETAFMYPEKQAWCVDDDMYYYFAAAYAEEQETLPIKERNYKIARDYLERIDFSVALPPSHYLLRSKIYFKIASANEAKGILLDENPALYQKALQAIAKCIDFDPNNVDYRIHRAVIYDRIKNPVKVLEDLLAAREACKLTDYRQKIENYLNDYLLGLDEATLDLLSVKQMSVALQILPKDDKFRLMRKCLYDLQSPLARWFRKWHDEAEIKKYYDELKYPAFLFDAPIIKEGSATFEQYMEFGKAFFDEQKYEEAMQCFNKAISLKEGIKLDTKNQIKLSGAYYQRGLLHYQIKQFDDGFKDMLEASRFNPRRFDFTQGMTENRYINYLSFNDKTELSPFRFKFNDQLFHFTQGFASLKNKKFFNAVVYFGEAIRRKDPKTLAASLYFQAKAYHCALDEPGLVERCSLMQPFSVSIIENLSRALQLEPNFTEAAELLNNYLLFQVTERDLNKISGEKIFSAIKLLSKEQQIGLLQHILSGKGQTALLKNHAHKYHLIEKMHEHLIKLDPDNYKNYYNGTKLTDEALFAVGNRFYKQGRIKQGEACHAEIKPGKLDVHYKRGAAYVAQARNDAMSNADMQSDMRTALPHLASCNSAKSYYQSGIARLFLREKSAWVNFTTAIVLNPKFAEAYNMRGLLHYIDKHYDHAIANFKSALECYPKYADAHLHLALAYEGKNDKAKAMEHYVKAMQIDKEYTKVCSSGERVDKKQKLKPLFASTNQDFAPHLAEVNQALTSPADKLTALFLNSKESELAPLSKGELFSLIKELPPKNQIVVLEKCLLKNAALRKRFEKRDFISPWGMDYVAEIEKHLLHLKNTQSIPCELLGSVQGQAVEVQVADIQSAAFLAQVAEVEISASIEIPQEQSIPLYPVYLHTGVQPQTQTPSPAVDMPPVAVQAKPASLYPPLYDAPPPVYVPATPPVYEQIVQPQTPVPVPVRASSLYPKLSDEAEVVFPVVPSTPIFTNNNVMMLTPPVGTPVVVPQPQAQAVTNQSEIYQQQKLKATETLRKYLEVPNPIEEMRTFLNNLDLDREWTVKSLFGKEQKGTPTHIKALKRLLSDHQSCLSNDSQTIWLFNQVFDIYAKLDPNSRYRTDSVKACVKARLIDGQRIKKLYENAVQASAAQKQAVPAFQQTVERPVLTPVFIATTRKDPINELNALPPAPTLTNQLNALPPAPTHTPVINPEGLQNKPTLFNRAKKAFGFHAEPKKVALKAR